MAKINKYTDYNLAIIQSIGRQFWLQVGLWVPQKIFLNCIIVKKKETSLRNKMGIFNIIIPIFIFLFRPLFLKNNSWNIPQSQVQDHKKWDDFKWTPLCNFNTFILRLKLWKINIAYRLHFENFSWTITDWKNHPQIPLWY